MTFPGFWFFEIVLVGGAIAGYRVLQELDWIKPSFAVGFAKGIALAHLIGFSVAAIVLPALYVWTVVLSGVP